MEGIDVELDGFALQPTILALNFVVLSPSLEDVAAPEVTHLSLSFIHKLPVSFGPIRKELVESLHLLGLLVVERPKFLLLDMKVPLFDGLASSLEAAISI